MIGNNKRSGLKVMKRNLIGPKAGEYYDMSDLKSVFPFYKDHEGMALRRHMFERRKMRILMKGIKFGTKKGGIDEAMMSIFDVKKKKK